MSSLLATFILALHPDFAPSEVTTWMPSPNAPKLLVLVIVDGMDPSYMDLPELPTIRKLAQEGAFCAQAETIFPPVTTPAITSIVTGAYPSTHSIPSITFFDRQLDKEVRAPRDNTAPTIAEVLQAYRLKTVSVGCFMLENRGADVHMPPKANLAQVEKLLDEHQPTLMAFYFPDADTLAHRHGPRSKPVRRALAEADAYLARLLQLLEQRKLLCETTLALTSDHGFTAYSLFGGLTTKLEAALSDSGLKWARSSDAPPAPDTQLVLVNMGRLAALTFRLPVPEETRAKLIEQLRAIDGVAAVLDASALALLRCSHRLGDLLVVAAPGHHFGGLLTRGGHGTFEELFVPLILWGKGIRKGTTLQDAKIIDLMPTFLHLLGIPSPPSVDGRVLTEAVAAE